MLKGLKVVEYATYIAAPGAGAILADWGADVVKIESPAGDPMRFFFDSIATETAINPCFEMDNRGKRGIVLDTTKPEALEALLKLIDGADVFLTNLRPSSLKRAGLDYETLAKRRPSLVYASVTGYGLQGPEADRAGFDIAAFWARSGVQALFTPKGAEPFPLRTGFGDHTTSLATAAGILAALYDRAQTGKGRLVESSLVRTANYVLGSDIGIQHVFGKVASTRARVAQVSPLTNYFKTKDERWVCLVSRQGGSDWKQIARAVRRPDLYEDQRFKSARGRRDNAAELVGLLDEAFGALTLAEAGAGLDEADIVWSPVQTAAEAVYDEQLIASGAVVDVPLARGGSFKSAASPVRFPGADDGPKGPTPRQGEHTRSVLASLGYSSDQIDAMIAAGAAAQA